MHRCEKCGKDFPADPRNPNFENPFIIALGCFIKCKNCGHDSPYDTLVDLRDHKVGALDLAGHSGLEYRALQVSEVIATAVSNFVQNMDRVVSLPFMLRWLIGTVSEHGALVHKVWDQISGERSENTNLASPADAALMQRFVAATSEAMVFQRKETTLAHGQVPTYLFRQIPIDDLVKWRGTSGVGIAIDSICSSMVINAWTAFEVLAEDLWVQCLNARPRLGFIAMDAEPETNDDPATLEKKRRVEFKYPADLLRIPGFDPMKQMGTVLSNKWGFDRTDGAKEAYLKAFKNCASEIKSIFEHPELRYLAKVRNVYVHNGGKADKEFVQSVREHPRLSAFQENQIIELDGTLVVELVSASIRRSKALIAFVDKWIKNNPH